MTRIYPANGFCDNPSAQAIARGLDHEARRISAAHTNEASLWLDRVQMQFGKDHENKANKAGYEAMEGVDGRSQSYRRAYAIRRYCEKLCAVELVKRHDGI